MSSFQQSGVGSGIRKVNMNSNRISDGDHSTIVSSLSGDDRQGHAPRSDEAIGTLKQSRDEMSADLVDARKAEEDCKTNHATFIAAEKRRSPVQQGRTDVINASKADEAADAGRSVFELHSVQSTAAVSCAGQAETANGGVDILELAQCVSQQSEQSVIESNPAAGLVEMASESDGSRVQPTHHGGVWGFEPYHPNSRTRSSLQQTTPQIHNKSWRSGHLHHSAWVEGHTGGSRSTPTAHPCPKMGRGCG